MFPHAQKPWAARLFLVPGVLLMLHGLSRPLLLLGARAPGRLVFQDREVSTRGAHRVRYQFQDRDGHTHTGTAFTAAPRVLGARTTIAYLPFYPEVSVPASLPYALVTGLGWALAGLAAFGLGRLLGGPRLAPPEPG